MTIVTTVVSVSHRYFEKRSRDFNIRHIKDLCRILDREPPTAEEFKAMTVWMMASMSMGLHRELPEE